MLSNETSRSRHISFSKKLRYKVIHTVSILKQNQIIRALTVPFMQARFDLGDIKYRQTHDSEVIRALRNTHSGERCFIVGNGPSLTIDDLESIRGEFTFAANRVYLLFDKTDWRPDIYTTVDRDFIANEFDVLASLPVKTKLISRTAFSVALVNNRDITTINVHARRYTLKRYSNTKVAFSNRPDLVLYDGFTVTFVAIQLALWMGFTEIYLIGVDHTFTHVVDPDGTVHLNPDITNHCFEDPKDAVINPQPKQGVDLAYRMAREESEKRGAHIYNATRGGALEIFERVNLDDVLGKETQL